MDKDEALRRLVEEGIEAGRLDARAIEAILDEGADPRAVAWGSSLPWAIAGSGAGGAARACEELAKRGADLDWRDGVGETAIGKAARLGDAEVAAALAKAGADLWIADDEGFDPMMRALEGLDAAVAAALLDGGLAASGCRDVHGRPALVALSGHPRASAIAFELLGRGADPNVADAEGWTPAGMAARCGAPGVLALLLEHGARAEAAGPGGLSPLALALGARPGRQVFGGAQVGPGHYECAALLARAGSPGWGSRPDARGLPPLARLCASTGRFEIEWMEGLALLGADPLAAGSQGWSLLRVAAEGGSETAATALARWALARGADPRDRCASGVLPERAAAAAGFFELEALLRSERERRELAGEGEGWACGQGRRL